MKQGDQCAIKKKSRTLSSFLKKTYQILQNPINSEIVCWASNGIGFIVVNEERFAKEVLPSYFKHSNYSSFVRQLNMYNFHKIRQGQSESYFYHQLFDRNNKSAIGQIKRKPQKKKRKMEESDDEDGDQEVSIYRSKKKLNSNCVIPKKLYQDSQKPSIADFDKKASLENTLQLVGSQHDPLCQQHREPGTQKNILSMELDDDRLSINQEIGERCPRFQTRELISPSNGLIPFSYHAAQMSNFSIIL